MFYPTFVRPLLMQQDPEKVHEVVCALGGYLESLPGGLSLLSGLFAPPNTPELQQQLLGVTFPNPLGLAAGFDKNIALTSLIRALGFGFEEAGSISAQPAMGNPKPRLFRLREDRAIINRMGLNNKGVTALLPRITGLPQNWPVGLSIVKTHNPEITGEAALDDFSQVLRGIYGYGAYVSINISCPNTAEGKTFEEPDALDQLLARLRQVEAECQAECNMQPRPWCLKISPDLSASQLQEMVEVANRHHIAGWVASNTTALRDSLKSAPAAVDRIGKGGLSGKPLGAKSTRVLGELYQMTKNNPDVVLIGVGGIHDAESAWQKIIHGASLLQIYTGLIYEGPELLKVIHYGLLNKLRQYGFSHIREAVGSAFR